MYSKLVTMRYQNYSMFKDETLEISDGITIMKGLNSNGKSWVLRGIQELFTCPSSRFQKGSIMFGETKSVLTATFSDGVSIEKEKFQTGRSSYTMRDINGEEIFSTIVDGSYTPVRELPEPIAYYLNLPSSDTVDLFYRKSRDKLLLVDTTGSENYEFLSNSLNNKELSDAISFVNRDRLDLRSDVTGMGVRFNALSEIIVDEEPTPIEIINKLELINDNYKKSLGKNSDLSEILNLVNRYNQNSSSYVSLQTINTKEISSLIELLSLVEKSNNISREIELKEVETKQVSDVMSILGLIDKYNNIETNMTLNSMKPLDESILVIFSELKKLIEINKVTNSINDEISKNKTEQQTLADGLKEEGYSITRCNNCDSLTVVNKENEEILLNHEHKEVSTNA